MIRALARYLVLTILALAGCSPRLKEGNAQYAVNQWTKSVDAYGAVTVVGVQEGRNNSAQATLRFSRFSYNNGYNRTSWDGTGTADFVHFNSGKWVLTQIQLKDIFVSPLSIEANGTAGPPTPREPNEQD